MNKFAVAYIRVSDPKQTKGYSLDSQDEKAIEKATQDGYEIKKVFREEGVSARTLDRPELQSLLTYCLKKSNEISAVYVYALNRLNRNTEDYLKIRKLLAFHGIRIVSVVEPTGDSPESEFIETILASISQFENQVRARVVANSLKKRFFSGFITSKPPLGYLMQKVSGKSVAVKDPETFTVIQMMWHRIMQERLSCRQVADTLNKLGLQSKVNKNFKRFTPSYVQRIFSSKFYMGVLVSKKYGEAQGKHSPMVDEKMFYTVRQILTGRRPSKHEKYTLMREDFPLRSMLNCHACGRKLTASWSKGNGGKYGYYTCSSRGIHKSTSFRKEVLEKKFLRLLKHLNFSKGYLKVFLALMREKYHSRTKLINSSYKDVATDISDLKKVKKNILLKHAQGVYTDEELVDLKDEVATQLIVKEGLLAEKRLEKLDIETTLGFIEYYLTHLDRVWTDATIQGKLVLAGSMFPDGITVENGEFRTARLARYYELTKEMAQGGVLLGEPNIAYFEPLDSLVQEYYTAYNLLHSYIPQFKE